LKGKRKLMGGRAEPEETMRTDEEELEYRIWNKWKSYKYGPWI